MKVNTGFSNLTSQSHNSRVNRLSPREIGIKNAVGCDSVVIYIPFALFFVDHEIYDDFLVPLDSLLLA